MILSCSKFKLKFKLPSVYYTCRFIQHCFGGGQVFILCTYSCPVLLPIYTIIVNFEK